MCVQGVKWYGNSEGLEVLVMEEWALAVNCVVVNLLKTL